MFKKLAAIALLSLPAALLAQTFPSKPITLIVPFSAGGPTDVVARNLAVALGHNLGQTVVVDNRPSAGGIVGSEALLRSEPDGYTVMIHNIGMATLPSLMRKLRFNPLNDFAYVGEVVDVPMTLVGKKDLPSKDFAELRTLISEKQKNIMIAHAGAGTASHLCSLLLMSQLNVQMTTIPYKGAAPALNDVMSSQVDLLCDQVTTTTQPIRNSLVKPFGATSAERLSTLPNLKTLSEQGLTGFEVSVWHGIYAPKKTPPAVVAKLSEALQKSLTDKDFLAAMGKLGAIPVPASRATPQALQQHLQQEVAKWAPVIDKAQAFLD